MSEEPEVSTGLVTATVTPSPQPGTQLPADWTIHTVAEMVNDVAVNMYDLPVILTKYKLTAGQYALLEQNEFFKSALEQAVKDWHSAKSVDRRLALKAALAVEHIMPDVTGRLGNSREPLNNVIAGLQALAKIAGLGEPKNQHAPPTEKFTIQINLGADIEKFEKSRPVVAIQSQSEGTGEDAPLQSLLNPPRDRP